ncbi:hypothetical protein SNEBB_011127 [Seison nebaliae]|nr:hypothetical protein SNEBB_011127 [Seison nebaliae]
MKKEFLGVVCLIFLLSTTNGLTLVDKKRISSLESTFDTNSVYVGQIDNELEIIANLKMFFGDDNVPQTIFWLLDEKFLFLSKTGGQILHFEETYKSKTFFSLTQTKIVHSEMLNNFQLINLIPDGYLSYKLAEGTNIIRVRLNATMEVDHFIQYRVLTDRYAKNKETVFGKQSPIFEGNLFEQWYPADSGLTVYECWKNPEQPGLYLYNWHDKPTKFYITYTIYIGGNLYGFPFSVEVPPVPIDEMTRDLIEVDDGEKVVNKTMFIKISIPLNTSIESVEISRFYKFDLIKKKSQKNMLKSVSNVADPMPDELVGDYLPVADARIPYAYEYHVEINVDIIYTDYGHKKLEIICGTQIFTFEFDINCNCSEIKLKIDENFPSNLAVLEMSSLLTSLTVKVNEKIPFIIETEEVCDISIESDCTYDFEKNSRKLFSLTFTAVDKCSISVKTHPTTRYFHMNHTVIVDQLEIEELSFDLPMISYTHSGYAVYCQLTYTYHQFIETGECQVENEPIVDDVVPYKSGQYQLLDVKYQKIYIMYNCFNAIQRSCRTIEKQIIQELTNVTISPKISLDQNSKFSMKIKFLTGSHINCNVSFNNNGTIVPPIVEEKNFRISYEENIIILKNLQYVESFNMIYMKLTNEISSIELEVPSKILDIFPKNMRIIIPELTYEEGSIVSYELEIGEEGEIFSNDINIESDATFLPPMAIGGITKPLSIVASNSGFNVILHRIYFKEDDQIYVAFCIFVVCSNFNEVQLFAGGEHSDSGVILFYDHQATISISLQDSGIPTYGKIDWGDGSFEPTTLSMTPYLEFKRSTVKSHTYNIYDKFNITFDLFNSKFQRTLINPVPITRKIQNVKIHYNSEAIKTTYNHAFLSLNKDIKLEIDIETIPESVDIEVDLLDRNLEVVNCKRFSKLNSVHGLKIYDLKEFRHLNTKNTIDNKNKGANHTIYDFEDLLTIVYVNVTINDHKYPDANYYTTMIKYYYGPQITKISCKITQSTNKIIAKENFQFEFKITCEGITSQFNNTYGLMLTAQSKMSVIPSEVYQLEREIVNENGTVSIHSLTNFKLISGRYEYVVELFIEETNIFIKLKKFSRNFYAVQAPSTFSCKLKGQEDLKFPKYKKGDIPEIHLATWNFGSIFELSAEYHIDQSKVSDKYIDFPRIIPQNDEFYNETISFPPLQRPDDNVYLKIYGHFSSSRSEKTLLCKFNVEVTYSLTSCKTYEGKLLYINDILVSPTENPIDEFRLKMQINLYSYSRYENCTYENNKFICNNYYGGIKEFPSAPTNGIEIILPDRFYFDIYLMIGLMGKEKSRIRCRTASPENVILSGKSHTEDTIVMIKQESVQYISWESMKKIIDVSTFDAMPVMTYNDFSFTQIYLTGFRVYVTIVGTNTFVVNSNNVFNLEVVEGDSNENVKKVNQNVEVYGRNTSVINCRNLMDGKGIITQLNSIITKELYPDFVELLIDNNKCLSNTSFNDSLFDNDPYGLYVLNISNTFLHYFQIDPTMAQLLMTNKFKIECHSQFLCFYKRGELFINYGSTIVFRGVPPVELRTVNSLNYFWTISYLTKDVYEFIDVLPSQIAQYSTVDDFEFNFNPMMNYQFPIDKSRGKIHSWKLMLEVRDIYKNIISKSGLIFHINYGPIGMEVKLRKEKSKFKLILENLKDYDGDQLTHVELFVRDGNKLIDYVFWERNSLSEKMTQFIEDFPLGLNNIWIRVYDEHNAFVEMALERSKNNGEMYEMNSGNFSDLLGPYELKKYHDHIDYVRKNINIILSRKANCTRMDEKTFITLFLDEFVGAKEIKQKFLLQYFSLEEYDGCFVFDELDQTLRETRKTSEKVTYETIDYQYGNFSITNAMISAIYERMKKSNLLFSKEREEIVHRTFVKKFYVHMLTRVYVPDSLSRISTISSLLTSLTKEANEIDLSIIKLIGDTCTHLSKELLDKYSKQYPLEILRPVALVISEVIANVLRSISAQQSGKLKITFGQMPIIDDVTNNEMDSETNKFCSEKFNGNFFQKCLQFYKNHLIINQREELINDLRSYISISYKRTISNILKTLSFHSAINSPVDILLPSKSFRSSLKSVSGRMIRKTVIYQGSSSIALTTWCEMKGYEKDTIEYDDCENESASEKLTIRSVVTQTVGSNRTDLNTSTDVSRNSQMVRIDIVNEENEEIPLKNMNKPIKIKIPPQPDSGRPVLYKAELQGKKSFFSYYKINRMRMNLHIPRGNTSRGLMVSVSTAQDEDNYICNEIQWDTGEEEFLKFTCDMTNVTDIIKFMMRSTNMETAPSSLSKSLVDSLKFEVFDYDLEYFVFFDSCQFVEEKSNLLSNEGIIMGKSSKWEFTECLATHLTEFAAGWVTLPEAIDFDYVFSNMNFNKNPTIYIFLIVLTLLYFLLLIPFRRWDRSDITKLGITPMIDNKPEDKYLYEMTFFTGQRQNSGTRSNVYFVLNGDIGETTIRTVPNTMEMNKKNRRQFNRGSVDSFLLSHHSSIGDILYLRLWHDNSGKGDHSSWYLKHVIIRNLQTDDKFYFIANRWFALDKEDGCIDRTLSVATEMEMKEFSFIFETKRQKSMNDTHLWYSVFKRPPQSNFTRVQRFTCCFVLLYLTMLMNIIYFDINKKKKQDEIFHIGPLSITVQQISIGVISSIIIILPSLFIVELFRRLKRKNPKKSEVAKAIDANRLKKYEKFHLNEFDSLKHEIFIDDQTDKKDKCPDGYIIKTKKKGKRKFLLPWWCIFVAYGVSLLMGMTAIAFILFKAISLTDRVVRDWLLSLFISTFSSIMVIQPLKIILIAIVFAFFCQNKKTDEDEDVEDDRIDGMKFYQLANDEEYLVDPKNNVENLVHIRMRLPNSMINSEEMRIEQMKRKYDSESHQIFKDFIKYIIFLLLISTIAFSYKSIDMSLISITTKNLLIPNHHLFLRNAFPSNNSRHIDFFQYINGKLLPYLYPSFKENDSNVPSPPFVLEDEQNILFGLPIIRQIRSKTNICPSNIPSNNCTPSFSLFHESKDDYGIFQKFNDSISLPAIVKDCYSYISSERLNGIFSFGKFATYAGGGYVVPLLSDKKFMDGLIRNLNEYHWIDGGTRALFIQWNSFNPSLNLFNWNQILFEVDPTEYTSLKITVEPLRIIQRLNGMNLIILIFQVLYVIFFLYYSIQWIKLMKKNYKEVKCLKKLFFNFWNIVEIILIICSISTIVFYFFCLYQIKKLSKKINLYDNIDSQNFHTHHDITTDNFLNMHQLSIWHGTYVEFVGIIVFFCTIKLLKLLSFTRYISVLLATIHNSLSDLLSFSSVFVIIFLAFISNFYLAFTSTISSFRTFGQTGLTACEMLLGKFSFQQMLSTNPKYLLFLLALYNFTIIWILMTMFMSIMNHYFEESSKKQQNEKDVAIYEYFLKKLHLDKIMRNSFQDKLTRNNEKIRKELNFCDSTTLLENRSDHLLFYINHIYMENYRTLDNLDEKLQFVHEQLKNNLKEKDRKKIQRNY